MRDVTMAAGTGGLGQFFAAGRASQPRWYPGAVIRMLATGEQTGGQFALFEAMTREGEEVPLHTHTREDEGLFVLDGEIRCEIGGDPIVAGAGDFVYLPRDVPHTWRATSERLHLLVLITPAGFECAFTEFSEPAPAWELPPADPPSDALLMRIVQRENELGVRYSFQE